jgi:MYXO-CTERM domain-containing protein
VNDAPVALAQSLRVDLAPTPLTLSATDVDGEALTYALLTQPSRGTLTGEPPQLVYTPADGFRGTVSFTFTASDGRATSAPALITLVVGNSAPVVALTANTLKPYEGEGVRFQVTAADANGDALTFHWDFGDGQTSEEQSPTHAFANEGTYEVALTVTDGVDLVSKALLLEVRNTAPVLVPLEAPAQAEEAQALTFRAHATDNGVNDALTYRWDFGDGSAPASGAEATHAYADDGTYTVKVTVTDDAGAFTQTVREVRVANVAPVPKAVPEQSIPAGEEVTVRLEATDAAGERDPLTWKRVEGPGTVTPEGLYRWTPEAHEQGLFPVRAQVADDSGGVADVVFTVAVTAGNTPPGIPPGDSGCGCTSGPQGAASTGLLLVLALLSARRKRA